MKPTRSINRRQSSSTGIRSVHTSLRSISHKKKPHTVPSKRPLNTSHRKPSSNVLINPRRTFAAGPFPGIDLNNASPEVVEAAKVRLKAAALAQPERVYLSYPISSLHIQRHGTRLFRSAGVSMNGFPLMQENSISLLPRLAGKHEFLMAVMDGHYGSSASVSLKGLIDNKFPALKMTAQNITKSFLWFDSQYNKQTMFRDGTTCCMIHGVPWDAAADIKIANVDEYLNKYDPTVEKIIREPADPFNDPNNKNKHPKMGNTIIDPLAQFPDNFVIKLTSINLGDSKAMVIRPNGNWIAITEDHTPQNRRERNRVLKAGGVIVEGRINGRLPITRSVGDKLFKQIEGVSPIDQMVVPLPDFEHHIMLPGDLLLIACNGLFTGTNMDYSTVAGLISDSINNRGPEFDPAAVLRDVFEVSLEQGSRENHSAILTQFRSGLDYVTPPLLETEIIPGPLPSLDGIDKEPASSPRFKFVKGYVADLMRGGYNLEDVHEYHKMRRDITFNAHEYDLEPIVFKGDIMSKIQDETAPPVNYNDNTEESKQSSSSATASSSWKSSFVKPKNNKQNKSTSTMSFDDDNMRTNNDTRVYDPTTLQLRVLTPEEQRLKHKPPEKPMTLNQLRNKFQETNLSFDAQQYATQHKQDQHNIQEQNHNKTTSAQRQNNPHYETINVNDLADNAASMDQYPPGPVKARSWMNVVKDTLFKRKH